MPAEHHGTRTPFGPHAESVGFVLSAAGQPSVYFAGDTGLHPAMADLAGVDVALIPVWGWGTNLGPGHLDPVTAADATALVDPGLVVPIHWGTFLPIGALTLTRIGRLVLRDPPERFERALTERGLASRLHVATAGTPVPMGTGR